MKYLHLISNAHLDPIWQWSWMEGAGAALSTFASAVHFCEKYDGYVFCHNEALLYQWIEEYDPALFSRIKQQIENGRWHIMGGWYLQPDCNLPSGEGIARQIERGQKYFSEKFGSSFKTAVNLDSFGHSRGLVQLLNLYGYESYLVARPGEEDCPLGSDDFIWQGYDGSRIVVHRNRFGYGSDFGKVMEKLKPWLEKNKEQENGIFLWGVGNHGGGPSAKDIEDLNEYAKTHPEMIVIHSTPEQYFEKLKGKQLPVITKGLNPWAVGCYSSGSRIKKEYRELENRLFFAEKIASHAAANGLMKYPKEELQEAERAMLITQFHDVLPGTAVETAMQEAGRTCAFGCELCARVAGRAFFALCIGQQRVGDETVFVYNPHPYLVETDIVCEFQLNGANWDGNWTIPEVWQKGEKLPAQLEKEESTIHLDWRKRVVFHAMLEPMSQNRFDLYLHRMAELPKPVAHIEDNHIVVRGKRLTVHINTQTGLMDRLVADGVEQTGKGAFHPIVMEDSGDSWGMLTKRFEKQVGAFQLLDKKENADFSGVSEETRLTSVRVIEDGAVRTVVEAVFGWNHSRICQQYLISKITDRVEVSVRVIWNEKYKMLKLAIPVSEKEAEFCYQTVFGTEGTCGCEAPIQRWCGMFGNGGLGVVNDGIYAADTDKNHLRLTLLRSPGYTHHPVNDLPLRPDDRFLPVMDTGEHLFRFLIVPNADKHRMEREAQIYNERPLAMALSPYRSGKEAESLVHVNAENTVAISLRREKEGFLIRLYNGGDTEKCVICSPLYQVELTVEMRQYQIKDIRLLTGEKPLLQEL